MIISRTYKLLILLLVFSTSLLMGASNLHHHDHVDYGQDYQDLHDQDHISLNQSNSDQSDLNHSDQHLTELNHSHGDSHNISCDLCVVTKDFQPDPLAQFQFAVDCPYLPSSKPAPLRHLKNAEGFLIRGPPTCLAA